MSEKLGIVVECEKGHRDVLTVQREGGVTREWLESWAGMLDGSYPLYVQPVTRLCEVCETPVTARVEDLAAHPSVAQVFGKLSVDDPRLTDGSGGADGAKICSNPPHEVEDKRPEDYDEDYRYGEQGCS